MCTGYNFLLTALSLKTLPISLIIRTKSILISKKMEENVYINADGFLVILLIPWLYDLYKKTCSSQNNNFFSFKFFFW